MTSPGNGNFHYTALFYRGHEEHRAGVAAFVRDTLSRDEPALVAVPGPAIGPVRGTLGAAAAAVTFKDMRLIGRTPHGSSPSSPTSRAAIPAA